MLESALCLLTFLVMIFGIMDFGRAVLAYNTLASVARDGARYAMVRGSGSGQQASSSDVRSYVRGRAIGLNSSDVSVTTSWSPDAAAGSTVAVAVTYAFYPLGPYMPAGPWNLQSTSKMTIAQ